MLLLNQLKGSLQDELDQFFQTLGLVQWGKRMLTAAALSKAKKKLKASAFVELNENALNIFYEEFPIQKQWHGFRLLAVDGSKIELPCDPEIEKKFDLHESSGRPMGLLSTLYDLNNRLWLHTELATLTIGEREVAVEHLKKTKKDDLILYDRGYPSFWFFAFHRDLGRHFCMRLQRSLFKETDDFFDSGQTDQIVQIEASKKRRGQCRFHGVSFCPMVLRLIRVELSSGEVEVLATSLLDSELYPTELFAELYHERWGHEEGYKHLKIHAELQNWTGKQLHTVFQDIHAKLLTLNLTAMQETVAQVLVDQKTEKRKHRYQVNHAQALSRMKDVIVWILSSPVNSLSWLQRLTEAMADNINAVREGRTFERKYRPGVGERVRPAYKRGR